MSVLVSLSPTWAAMAAAAAVLVTVSTTRAGLRTLDGGRAIRRLQRDRSRSGVPPGVATALRRAGLGGDPDTWWRRWVGAVVVVLVASPIVPAGPFVAIVVILGPPAVVTALRDRGAAKRAAQLPVALDAVASSLRGGRSLALALADASSVGPPIGPELQELARRADAGRSLVEVTAAWTDEAADGASRLAGAALAVTATVGGPGADAVEAAAASLRDRQMIDGEIAALSVQARLSGLVLTVAPVAFALLVVSLDPAASGFLFGSPLGWACVGAGLTLDGIGAVWMRQLIGAAR